MGQYYKVFNLDATQKLYPRAYGNGLKLMEFGASAYSTMSALALLLAKGADREGPWAGQRIVVSGDYADAGKFVPESHAEFTLQAYDYRADEEDQEGGSSSKPDRFVEVADIARSIAADVLPKDHPFLVPGRGAPGLEKLMADDSVFDTPEELFDALAVRAYEDLRTTVTDIQRSIRCGELVSELAWNYRPISADYTENAAGDRIEQLKVGYQRDRGDKGPFKLTQTLNFPAASQQVREFLQITARES